MGQPIGSHPWHRWGCRQHKPLLRWYFHPHARLLSAARPFYLHVNTSSLLLKVSVFFFSPHCFCIPILCMILCNWKQFHQAIKIIIAACFKKNWVSGAANNPRSQSSNKSAAFKVPGCPQFQWAQGTPALLGGSPWLAGLRCHHGKLAQVATNE